MPTRRAQTGLTLVELMMVVVIASLLLAVTAPSMRGLILRNRLEGSVNELGMDLYYARSEALRRRATVSLVTNSTGTAYTLGTSTLALKSVSLPTGVTLSRNVTVAFDGMRGATQGDSSLDASVSGLTELALRASVTAVGRVSVCTVTGSLPGMPRC
ncbi:GspH/FimT family pseudopilin [Ideonella sp. DXS22W]|uniref:Type II secretion system protein H n=1 Tax=Pseudaquabacterium inlustre TaxID=2984192 RepID=A0ABU9CFI1_9BURK